MNVLMILKMAIALDEKYIDLAKKDKILTL